MRRALVTGATGGLGMSLVETLLGENYEVVATGRDTARGAILRTRGADFRPGDLRLPPVAGDLLKEVDVVFHAAARSSPWGTLAEFEAMNLDVTARLLEAAMAAHVQRFIFVSTPSIYGEGRDRLNLSEQSALPLRFETAYAATKYAAERLVLAADGRAFRTLALRPRAIVGPWDQVLIPRLSRIGRRGIFPLFRGGRRLVEITDVRDLCRALVQADRTAAHGKAYNISGGAPLPARDLLDLAFQALRVSPRFVHVPFGLAAAGAKVLEGLYARIPGRPEPPVTRYSLGVLAFSQTFDLGAARRDLEWRPRHTPAEAIAHAVAGGHDA